MCNLVKIKSNTGEDVMVADIKKELIENIIDVAKECKYIQYIYLFGSSLETRCNDMSDIDILVVSNVIKSKLYTSKAFVTFMANLYSKDDYTENYDVLCVHGIDKLYKDRDKVHLFNDVLTEGKIIYTKGE